MSVVILGRQRVHGASLQGPVSVLQMLRQGIHQALRRPENKLGSPDLMIFFTSTMSHKLVQSALSELKGTPTRIERCHTSSLSALRSILEKHAG